ncbi:peroxiredoxin-like family protein [Shewanella glacialimarina]|uniref:peroxiredoxin-like family protein n=1 Tax=Shewanella glacialimarina TaxID=2590884 RepID=UPI001CF89753|nr:peroxiredoxin-like family protein [Shewanella glacialimarina]UCX05682.1 AhpC/TSA family protein [Shewanella glacialimarina]
MFNKLVLVATLAVASLTAIAKPIALDENNISPLLNGHEIPDVTLTTVDGKAVNLKELVSQKKTMFFFYRGGWCPFCNVQMGQLQAIEPKLIEMGIQLVGISPDSPEKLQASMTKNKLNYLLLSDEKMAAAQAFGLAFYTSDKVTSLYQAKLGVSNTLYNMPTGEARLVLPVPAIYLSDKTGLIQFMYANPNYKVRAAPELILMAASLVE